MKVLILGAAGSIGSALAKKLTGLGHEVISTTKRDDVPLGSIAGTVVTDINVCRNTLESELLTFAPFDAVVYAVGHCPPGGMNDASSKPHSAIDLDDYCYEINAHLVGSLNAFQHVLPLLKDGGCMLFITSAMTRFKKVFGDPKTGFPPFINAEYHAGLIAAQDWLIDGFRKDPAVVGRAIKIHRIAPGAIDTPFHSNGPKPPAMLSIGEVVNASVMALSSAVTIDSELIATPKSA